VTDAQVSPGDIAIVGMAGRFPKSPDVAMLWEPSDDGMRLSICHPASAASCS